MALGLRFSANLQPNLVLMPVPMVVRIAAGSFTTDPVAGTFTLTGTPAGALVWSLRGQPAGGTLVITPTPGVSNGTSYDLSFNNVPQRVAPYLLVISVTDGTSLAQTSLALVVRPGLTVSQLVVDSRITGSGPWTVTGSSYDATLPSLQFVAEAGSTLLANAQFIAPDSSSLLPGLSFELSGSSTALLAVAQPSPLSPGGGLAAGVESEVVAFQVYEPNTLYDSPSNALGVSVTYSLGMVSLGTLQAGLGGSYDPTSNDVFLTLTPFYQNGEAQAYSIAWSVSAGATGDWVGGAPGSHATSLVWAPSGSATQSVTFTASLTDPSRLSNPLVLTAGPFDLAPTGSWVGTTALQVSLPQGQTLTQDQGKTAWVAVQLPDLQVGETGQVTLSMTSLPLPLPSDPAPQSVELVQTGSTPTAFFAVPIPAGANLNQMWSLSLTAQATTGVTTRVGYGQQLLICSGAPQLVVTPALSSLQVAAGVFLPPVAVTVQAWQQLPETPTSLAAMAAPTLAQFLSSTPNAVNSSLVPVTGASLYLVGAPTGLSCASGQLSGILPQPGATSFTLTASAPGYQPGSPAAVTLTATGSSPLAQVAWQNPAFAFSNGSLALGWATSGLVTGLQLQESTAAATPDIILSWATGSGSQPTQLSLELSTTQAFLLAVTNALGTSYSQPLVVQPGSAASSSLPISPLTATLDSNGNLSLLWTPPEVSGVNYSYWTVWAQTGTASLPFALPNSPHTGSSLLATDGAGPGSTYSYTTALGNAAAGYLSLQMQAFGPSTGVTSPLWDAYDAFPAPQGAYVSIATGTSVSINQPFTVLLEPISVTGTGPSGDSWWVQVQHLTGSTPTGAPVVTNPLPLSLTAVPMALPSAFTGSNQVTVFISRTLTNSDGTPITLIRSFLVAQPLVVSSSVYQGNTLAYPVAAKFDVAGANGVIPAPDDYMAIAPSLVRDETTHEFKLMLATARGNSASSQLGTMAVDVFPLKGRPHTTDLLDLTALSTPAPVVAAPLVILSTALEDAVAGGPVTPFQLQAQGGVPPYRWFSQTLPQGMYLSQDGIVTGAPVSTGLFSITISVQDSQSTPFSADTPLSLFVSRSNVVISGGLDSAGNPVTTLPTVHVGTFYAAGLQATQGVAPYTWTLLAGSMPPGLSLNPSSGAITGWSSTVSTLAATGQSFTPTFEVTDAVGGTFMLAMPMTLLPMGLTLGAIDQSLLITGVDTKLCVPVTGGIPFTHPSPAYTLTTSAGLPTGVTPILVNGTIQLTIPRTYTPTPAVYGGYPQFSFSLTVTDNASTPATVTRSYTLTFTPANSMATWADACFPSKIGGLLGGGYLNSGVIGGPTSGSAGPLVDGADSVNFTGTNAGDTVALSISSAVSGATLAQLVLDDPNSSPFRVSLLSLPQTPPTPPTGANLEVVVRAAVTTSAGLTYEKAAREYSIGSLVYQDTTYGFQLLAVSPLPVSLYEPFAFDPQFPAKNASAPTITGFDQVALASFTEQLPSGVSLDSVTGTLYGAIQAPPTRATTTLGYYLAGVQIGSAVITWNVYGSDLVITPTPVVLDPVLHTYLSGGIPGAAGTNYPTTVCGEPYLATLTVAGATNQQLASGGSPAAPLVPVVIHGCLPLGVTLTVNQGNSFTNNPPTLVLSGAPIESGVFEPVIRVLDSNPLRSGLFKVRIVVTASPLLNLVTASIPAMVSGLAYAATLSATGGNVPYTWTSAPQVGDTIPAGVSSITGLPTGITLNAATGVVSGTTSTSGMTNLPVVFTVTDANGTQVPRTLLLSANPSGTLHVFTSGLPGGVIGGSYEAPLEAFGGVPNSLGNYLWSSTPTSPGGLTLNPNSGVLSGIPSASYSGNVTVTVTDYQSPTPNTASVVLPLSIASSGTPIITATLPEGYLGQPYGSSDTSSGIATGSCGVMAASPAFSWTKAHKLNLGSQVYMVVVGGFRCPVAGGQYVISARSAPSENPIYLSLSAVNNDTQAIGSWGTMPGTVDPTMTNHMLSATAVMNTGASNPAAASTEIVVIGGVANDRNQTQGPGTPLDQATLMAFTVDNNGNPIPASTTYGYPYSVTVSGVTTVSPVFNLNSLTGDNPVITKRYGAAAVNLGLDAVFMCGGISRANPSPATPGIPGLRDDLTVDGNGEYRSQYAYLLKLTRTVPGQGKPTAASWTALTPMPVPLVFHQALKLNDGRIMILGGLRDLQGESSAWTPAADGQGSNLCLIYNPTLDPLYPGSGASGGSNPWTFDAALPIQAIVPAACVLPNGQVFLAAPATAPWASDPANQVNGAPLSTSNCILLYTPTTTPAITTAVGSWAVFPTTPLSTGNNPRNEIPWGASAHTFGAGLVAIAGGELNLRGDGQTVQSPLTPPWNGAFDPNAIGLQGSLFNAALVGNDATTGSLAVYSNPATGSYFFSTNTVAQAGVFLTASGGVPPYHSWGVTPALPTGMSLDPDTGELTGLPVVATPPGQAYTFTVTDSRTPLAAQRSQAFMLQVLDPTAPIWTSAPGAIAGPVGGVAFVQGPYGSPTPISVQLLAHSNTYTSSGGVDTLTGTVNLTDFQSSLYCNVVQGATALFTAGIGVTAQGLISGVPTLAGVYNFTVRAYNTTLNAEHVTPATVDLPLTLTVYGNLQITAYGTWGSSSPTTVTCPPAYAPNLPGSQTATTPATSVMPQAYLGSPYYVNLSVHNGTAPYTWTATGLAGDVTSGGISFVAGESITSQLTVVGSQFATLLCRSAVGPVSGLTSATITPTVTVTDAKGLIQKAVLSITVGANAIQATPVLPPATVDVPYSQVISLSGGYIGTGTYHLSGPYTNLPAGMSLVMVSGVLTLSGTPAYGSQGAPTIYFSITDDATPTASTVTCFTQLPINLGSFAWKSGPQLNVSGLWPEPLDFLTSFLPLAIAWDRFHSAGYGNSGVHAQDQQPWIAEVTGTFQTNHPSLSFGALGDYGATVTATLIQAPTPGVSSTAIFAVTVAGALNLTNTGAFYLPCTLIDGAGVAEAGQLGGYFRATGPGNGSFPGENPGFVTPSGVLSPSTYGTYPSAIYIPVLDGVMAQLNFVSTIGSPVYEPYGPGYNNIFTNNFATTPAILEAALAAPAPGSLTGGSASWQSGCASWTFDSGVGDTYYHNLYMTFSGVLPAMTTGVQPAGWILRERGWQVETVPAGGFVTAMSFYDADDPTQVNGVSANRHPVFLVPYFGNYYSGNGLAVTPSTPTLGGANGQTVSNATVTVTLPKPLNPGQTLAGMTLIPTSAAGGGASGLNNSPVNLLAATTMTASTNAYGQITGFVITIPLSAASQNPASGGQGQVVPGTSYNFGFTITEQLTYLNTYGMVTNGTVTICAGACVINVPDDSVGPVVSSAVISAASGGISYYSSYLNQTLFMGTVQVTFYATDPEGINPTATLTFPGVMTQSVTSSSTDPWVLTVTPALPFNGNPQQVTLLVGNNDAHGSRGSTVNVTTANGGLVAIYTSPAYRSFVIPATTSAGTPTPVTWQIPLPPAFVSSITLTHSSTYSAARNGTITLASIPGPGASVTINGVQITNTGDTLLTVTVLSGNGASWLFGPVLGIPSTTYGSTYTVTDPNVFTCRVITPLGYYDAPQVSVGVVYTVYHTSTGS